MKFLVATGEKFPGGLGKRATGSPRALGDLGVGGGGWGHTVRTPEVQNAFELLLKMGWGAELAGQTDDGLAAVPGFEPGRNPGKFSEGCHFAALIID